MFELMTHGIEVNLAKQSQHCCQQSDNQLNDRKDCFSCLHHLIGLNSMIFGCRNQNLLIK